MTATFAIVKRLLASNKISFIITALVVLCATSSGDVVLSNGNYTWLLAGMTPFFFVFYDYTKLMHLGASKKDYYIGCLISYGILAFGISFVNTMIHLLLVMIFLHVLLSMQPHWYGWLTDAVLVAIISIFTPIAPLRAVLGGFFQIIMLNSNAILHIGACLLLSIALSFVGLLVLKKKTL